MLPLRAPVLSAWDPIAESEGSIDPLGLAGTYDRLADELLPGVTVRMGRPRFLTAIAVGAHVCQDFGPDVLASDQVTPPWQVFEWWVVESFARCPETLKEKGRIPGIQKAQNAVRNGRPLSAPAYLQVPSVFGFTGVFRRLARRAQIITSQGALDQSGLRLVEQWSQERGLTGFTGNTGLGKNFRDGLSRAVRDGLGEAHTSSRPGAFWEAIAHHLDPSAPGRRERATLLELIEERSGSVDEIRVLSDSLRKHGQSIEFSDEAKFLRRLRKDAPARMKLVLEAIDVYETFCRPLNDLFDLLRFLASMEPSRGVSMDEFRKHPATSSLCDSFVGALSAVGDNELIGEHWRERSSVLSLLREGKDPESLFGILFQHHVQAQGRKPPEGKRPWLEQGPRNRLLVRAGYRLDELPQPVSAYLHEYRVPTYSRFLRDLGAIR